MHDFDLSAIYEGDYPAAPYIQWKTLVEAEATKGIPSNGHIIEGITGCGDVPPTPLRSPYPAKALRPDDLQLPQRFPRPRDRGIAKRLCDATGQPFKIVVEQRLQWGRGNLSQVFLVKLLDS